MFEQLLDNTNAAAPRLTGRALVTVECLLACAAFIAAVVIGAVTDALLEALLR